MSLIFKQIPLIMSEVGAIEKNRKGDGINYKFRGIDDIYMALQPLLAKHKVFYAPNVIHQAREGRTTKSGSILTYSILTIEFTFYAEDGSHFKLVTVGEAMDTSDKSSNKAMSAALKAAALQLFCIPTEEEKDTEYQHHEPAPAPAPSKFASEAQSKRLYAIQKKVGMPDAQLKIMASAMGIASSREIPIDKYESLCTLVESWKPIR